MAEPLIELRLGAPAWEGLEDDAEALFAQWDAAVGDVVVAGQEIGLVELVKASVPLVAPVAGRIVERCIGAGESFGRATVLARLRPQQPTGPLGDQVSWKGADM